MSADLALPDTGTPLLPETRPVSAVLPGFEVATIGSRFQYHIGGVIGHEITHGFDDQGSRFDADGNLKMWWTDSDRKQFEERAACVVKQFDGYEVQPGLFINGKLTLGENIGDFAGLTVSYYAFQRSLEGKPRRTCWRRHSFDKLAT